MSIEVRPVVEAEWRVLRDIRLTALLDSPGAFGSTHAREVAFGEETWRDRISNGHWWFAWSGEVLAGIVATFSPDPEGSPAERHVVSMWVAPSERHAGVARALLAALEDWAVADGATRLSLWVADGNDSATRLYTSLGYAATGETAPLPSDPARSEHRMVRELTL